MDITTSLWTLLFSMTILLIANLAISTFNCFMLGKILGLLNRLIAFLKEILRAM